MTPSPLARKGIPLLIVVVALVVSVLLWSKPAPNPDLRQPPVPVVEVVTVARVDFSPVDQVTGRLRPAHKAFLRSEVSGRLAERTVDPGQIVEDGALLMRLEDSDYVDAVREARALLEQEQEGISRDRHLLELAGRSRQLQKNEVGRLERLGRESLASASRLDEARRSLLNSESEEARLRYSVDTADARLDLREAALERAERNLKRTRILAPFRGVVNAVLVDAGDYVTTATTVLELVDTGLLDVYAQVPGATAVALKLGARVDVLVGSRSLQGELISMQKDPDPTTLTHAIRIRVSGEGLLPGMLARFRLPLEALAGVLAVPVSAVLKDEGTAYVFIVNPDGSLSRRAIRRGARQGDMQVLLGGVEPGEIVVARDVAALSDGIKVTVSQAQDSAG